MATILHIKASIRGERSYSNQAAAAFLESYIEAHPEDAVRTVDLAAAGLPEFDAEAVAGKYAIMSGKEHGPEEAQAWKAVTAAIEEFKSADKVLISAPMWNFGIPYRLKQYIDVIVQPGHTFSFSPEAGYTGLVTGRPAMLILARGGAYAAGTDAAAVDFQHPYLEHVLRFIGFENIDSIVVEPTLGGGPRAAKQSLEDAVALAREKARSF
jgi:FMN-dependent NADH-azoreductase